MITLLAALISFSATAEAREITVPNKAAQGLFRALADAFPEAHRGGNRSESIWIENVHCVANEDEERCTATTEDGLEVKVDVDDGQPSQGQLVAIWKSARAASLPVGKNRLFTALRLRYLACDHYMPAGGRDSFSCAYRMHELPIMGAAQYRGEK